MNPALRVSAGRPVYGALLSQIVVTGERGSR
jgi:hypothetical protein